MSSFATILVWSFPNGRCRPIRISSGVMIHTTAGVSMMPTTNAAPASSATTEMITSEDIVREQARREAQRNGRRRAGHDQPLRDRGAFAKADVVAGGRVVHCGRLISSAAKLHGRVRGVKQQRAAAAMRPQLLAFSSLATVRSISS